MRELPARFRCIILFLVLFLLTFSAFSQEEQIKFPVDKIKLKQKSPYYWNAIKIAPIALFMGQIPYAAELRGIYELAVSPKNSFFVGVSLNFQNVITRSIWDNYNDTVNSQGCPNCEFVANIGGRVQAGYKFFLLKRQHAPEGLFVGPHFSYNRLRVVDKSNNSGLDKAYIQFLNVNILGGYQLIAGRFVLEALTGIGYRRNWVDYYYINNTKARYSWFEENRVLNHIKFTLSVNLGVAF